MAFKADDYIGKTATAKGPLKLDFFVNGIAAGAKEYKAGDNIGKIFSWTGSGDALMFIIDTELHMQPGQINVHPSQINGMTLESEVTEDKKKESEKKAKEAKDNESVTDKLIESGKTMMKWIAGALVAYFVTKLIFERVFEAKAAA